MASLSPPLQKQLRDVFAGLPRPVTLAVFTKRNGTGSPCETCDDTQQLVDELTSISGGKVLAEVYDIDRDTSKPRLYGIDKGRRLSCWAVSPHEGILAFASLGRCRDMSSGR